MGTGFAALFAALLTLALSAPSAPADAAQTGATATENGGGEVEKAAPAPQAEEGAGGPPASTESGDDEADGSAEKESNADESPEKTTAQESPKPARESTNEMVDKGNSGIAEKSEKSTDNPTETTTSTETGSVPDSVLTVAVSNAKGEPVVGVAFTLWQETNGVAQLQQQGEADATEEAWTCRTSTEGTCAVGEDQGRPGLAPGTYYWVQTDAPEGYVTPAEQPVATARITEAEAGTDLEPAQVTVAEAAPEEDQAGKQADEPGDEGTTAEDEALSNGESATDGAGAPADESGTDAASDSSGADEETGPVEDAEEEAEADGPDDEGAEGSSEEKEPTEESEEGSSGPSATNQQEQGAPLVAPNLAAVPTAQGPVQIGSLQARIANQTSDGNYPCLTYAPAASGDRTAWVTNPDEAQAGHAGPHWVGIIFPHLECATRVNTWDQSVAGIRPSTVTSVTPGTSFLLGQTTHYNNPIDASAGHHINGDLSIRMADIDGATFTVPWQIWETPNGADRRGNCANGEDEDSRLNRNGCADRIRFDSQVSDQTVQIDGGTYTLVFEGFAPADGHACPAEKPSNTQNVFWTKERATTSACMYARLVQVRDLTIVKSAEAEDGDAPGFSFSSDSSLDGSQWADREFSLDPDGDDRRTGTVAQGEQITVTEADSAQQWQLQDVTCTGLTEADYQVSLDTGELTLTVPTGTGDIVCTFLNRELVPGISIDKQAWDVSEAGDWAGVGDIDAPELEGGTSVASGTTITWTYTVTNTGSTPLTDIAVNDNQLGGTTDGAITCPRTDLEPEESMLCTASGAVRAL